MLASSAGARINLANIFIEYANSERSRRRILIDKYCLMLSAHAYETPKLWTMAAKGVFLGVRSRYDYMALEIESRGENTPVQALVSWPLSDELQVRLLYDLGPSMSHVSRSVFETWGINEDVVRKQAMANLRSLERPTWADVGEGVFQLISTVAYEESFFLLDEVMAMLPFVEDAVVMPVNRGVLVAASARSNAALVAMLRHAFTSLQEKPWPMAGSMLIRSGSDWVKFVPQGDIARFAIAVQRLSRAQIYRDQKDALEKHCEKIGDDVFVATYDLRQRGDDIDGIFSWCTWAQGVRTLLPKSDVIAMGKGVIEGNGETLFVKWNHVERICGRYLQPTDENPIRFRVHDFPNDEEWTQLKDLKATDS